MTGFQKEESLNLTNGLDLVTFGQRLRHLRRLRGLTLADLGERVGRAPSQLSLLENGRIIAVGTHSELMSTVQAYRDLLASRDDASAAQHSSKARSS